MSTTTTHSPGRTVEKELFIAAAPERVYRAFTDKQELETWFVRKADVGSAPGGPFNLTWGENSSDGVAGKIIALDPPHRFVFEWDDGPEYGLTTCTVEFLPHADGTLLRLTHTGFGDGEHWDSLYNDINGGWNSELEHLRLWVEFGTRPERGSATA
jgi:uncharacterized protein YndB with AHSA1/START domain